MFLNKLFFLSLFLSKASSTWSWYMNQYINVMNPAWPAKFKTIQFKYETYCSSLLLNWLLLRDLELGTIALIDSAANGSYWWRALAACARYERFHGAWVVITICLRYPRVRNIVVDIAQRISMLKWQWACHVCRTDDRWSRRVINWRPSLGRRARCPAPSWSDDLKRGTGSWMRKSRIANAEVIWRGPTSSSEWIIALDKLKEWEVKG